MKKRIEYSYPTSTNAVQFGHGKTGCYTVELTNGVNPPKAVDGFITLAEARRFAETMPQEWDKITR